MARHAGLVALVFVALLFTSALAGCAGCEPNPCNEPNQCNEPNPCNEPNQCNQPNPCNTGCGPQYGMTPTTPTVQDGGLGWR